MSPSIPAYPTELSPTENELPDLRAASPDAEIAAALVRTAGRLAARMRSMAKSQFTACSGKRPVCLKFMGLTWKVSSP